MFLARLSQSVNYLQSFVIAVLFIYITTGGKPSDFTDQKHLMQPSPYRGQPTPEIEAAFIRLWRFPPIHFPEDKLTSHNKTPAESYEHVSKELGGNITTFRAIKDIVRRHVDHCIDTIRHFLMCQSEVTPVVFEKDLSLPSGSKNNFYMRRKCRNFEKIQA
ncbi:hypothetical protein LX32DRAFT_661192 [Colletotrichum zoysiae]|uniref:Uncharacterized protein n=1 Tax=Colletotrichum zoysiae TaxID=1216348 RepID=A0AAD9M8D8_9PEZI|nr:hypothetical protein LX32DRAFT_661192 [Colletotrichum zoysiae]